MGSVFRRPRWGAGFHRLTLEGAASGAEAKSGRHAQLEFSLASIGSAVIRAESRIPQEKQTCDLQQRLGRDYSSIFSFASIIVLESANNMDGHARGTRRQRRRARAAVRQRKQAVADVKPESAPASAPCASAAGTIRAAQTRLGDDVQALVTSFVDPAGEIHRLQERLRTELTWKGSAAYLRRGDDAFLNPRVGDRVCIKFNAVQQAVEHKDFSSPLVNLYLECGRVINGDNFRCSKCSQSPSLCYCFGFPDHEVWKHNVQCTWLGKVVRPVAAADDGPPAAHQCEAVMLGVQVGGRPTQSTWIRRRCRMQPRRSWSSRNYSCRPASDPLIRAETANQRRGAVTLFLAHVCTCSTT